VRSRIAARRESLDGSEPQDVIPFQLARRRARWGLGVVFGAWVIFGATTGLLVRAHEINERCTGYSVGASAVAWFLVFPIWYGMSWRPQLVTSGGHRFIVARTITGPRAVALDELASARRFQGPTKGGGTWDELRLRDRHGVRLSLDRVHGMESSIRDGIESGGLRVSGAVMRKLDVGRRWGYRAGGRGLLGLVIIVGSLGTFILAGLAATCLIAGTPIGL